MKKKIVLASIGILVPLYYHLGWIYNWNKYHLLNQSEKQEKFNKTIPFVTDHTTFYQILVVVLPIFSLIILLNYFTSNLSNVIKLFYLLLIGLTGMMILLGIWQLL